MDRLLKRKEVETFSAGVKGKESERMDRLLKRKEVETLTGLSRSSLYRWIERGQFPKPLRLSTRTVRWEESTIHDWMKALRP